MAWNVVAMSIISAVIFNICIVSKLSVGLSSCRNLSMGQKPHGTLTHWDYKPSRASHAVSCINCSNFSSSVNFKHRRNVTQHKPRNLCICISITETSTVQSFGLFFWRVVKFGSISHLHRGCVSSSNSVQGPLTSPLYKNRIIPVKGLAISQWPSYHAVCGRWSLIYIRRANITEVLLSWCYLRGQWMG